jgi:hypothetical protein
LKIIRISLKYRCSLIPALKQSVFKHFATMYKHAGEFSPVIFTSLLKLNEVQTTLKSMYMDSSIKNQQCSSCFNFDEMNPFYGAIVYPREARVGQISQIVTLTKIYRVHFQTSKPNEFYLRLAVLTHRTVRKKHLRV